MKNELKLLGESVVNGKEIKTIEGGFGEGQKCITVQDIALQHETPIRKVNELIGNNKEKFSRDEIIDLMAEEKSLILAKDLGLITNNRQKYCYILSQRGYIKLVSMMANDNSKKWEVMNYLINDYFNMKQELEEQKPQLSPQEQLALQLFNGGIDAITTHKQLLALETKELNDKIEE